MRNDAGGFTDEIISFLHFIDAYLQYFVGIILFQFLKSFTLYYGNKMRTLHFFLVLKPMSAFYE